MQLIGLGELRSRTARKDYMKPINRRYHDLDDTTKQSWLTWDLSNGDEIVVHDLTTFGEVTDGKEQLTALAQAVCDSYEENL